MRYVHPLANGLSTDHPMPGLPFIDDAHLPRHPRWIENVGRHRGQGSWGRCDGPGFGPAETDDWAAFTTDQANPGYAWCVRHHRDHGRTVVLVRDSDAASLHDAWIDSAGGVQLFRSGGYWWNGTWYRPLQIFDQAAGKYLHHQVADAVTVTAARLLADSGAEPARAALVTIDALGVGYAPDEWADHLALWASHRPDRARPLTDCIVDLAAPELVDDQLVGLEVLADMADIDRSIARGLYERGQQFPDPQTVVDGRPLWSKAVAADWSETRERSGEGLLNAMSSPAPENPQIVVGLNDLWNRYTDTFTRTLRHQFRPPAQSPNPFWQRLSRRAPADGTPAEDTIGRIARTLAWAVPVDLGHIVPIGPLAAAVRTAIVTDLLDDLKLDTELHGGKPSKHPLVSISRQLAIMLDWLIRHDPVNAAHTINEIIGDAERLGVPRSSSIRAIRLGLATDGELPETGYDRYLQRALPPQTD